MSLEFKKKVVVAVALLFLASLVFVQYLEINRRRVEAGLEEHTVIVPETSEGCVTCHQALTPGIIDQWRGSTHARSGVGCFECHEAQKGDADGFDHYGKHIATVVTPKDCARCHTVEAAEFQRSHHAAGGLILDSLDNFLADNVEGSKVPFNPHAGTPGFENIMVNGMAVSASGCQQCHGSKIGLLSTDGGMITVDDLKPDADGKPTNAEAMAKIAKDPSGKPLFHASTWPNTGIGRLNLDGSRGSCSACHSRHDFSPRRARQPENCGKCHLGPDHPQKEIYEESKHGVAYRDLKDEMHLDAKHWVLGKDYSQAPTCATCHMSGHSRNGGKVTHDPGERISWTNRPAVSLLMDTDADGNIVTATDPAEREKLITDSWEDKRSRMQEVCSHCHVQSYIDGFYKQYDDLVLLYNEKFAKAGQEIMDALHANELINKTQFDEKIEWSWFHLWHHEGRRARHGASMMAPDYVQWVGMYEVAQTFYMELIPEAKALAKAAEADGKTAQAAAVNKVIDDILARPEHQWFKLGAEAQSLQIKNASKSPAASSTSP